jgi:hypothetical protein
MCRHVLRLTVHATARKIMAIWNARLACGLALWSYPTIGAAIAAGVACQQVGSIDLRALDRHPVHRSQA